MVASATRASTCKSCPTGSTTKTVRVVASIRLPVPDFTPRRVHALVGQILRQRQFRQPSKPWTTRAEAWLARELDRLLTSLVTGGHATGLGWVIIVAVAVATAFLVTRFARRVKLDPGVDTDISRRARKTATDWTAEAIAHERAGQWRDALRARYRALIAELAERGVLDEVPGRTTREYQALVTRNLPDAVAEFGGASELFEAAWYGNHAGGPAEQEQLKELSRRVLVEAGRR